MKSFKYDIVSSCIMNPSHINDISTIETLEQDVKYVQIKTPERRHCSGVFIVNFEHFSRLVLVFLLLTLNI